MVVLPGWLDQVPTVDYSPEKDLLRELERWAQQNGWNVSDGSKLSIELRQRTDVLLERPSYDQRLRVAVLPKSRSGKGTIRVDASNLRTVELLYQRKQPHWRVEAGGVRVEDDLLRRGWDWLIKLMFQP
jgi:hypothetical protein